MSQVRQLLFKVAAKIFRLPILSGMLHAMSENVGLRRNAEGVLAFPYLNLRKSSGFQILTYHRVNDENDWVFAGTPVDVFKSQMEYLKENWNVLSLEEAVRRMKTRDIPERTVVITFDDGYQDNSVHAFPILKDLEIPATFFVVTGAIDCNVPIWHDRVFFAFRKTTVSVLKGFGDPPADYGLGDKAAKLSAMHGVLTYIRTLDR